MPPTELSPTLSPEVNLFCKSIEHMPQMDRIEALVTRSLQLQYDGIQQTQRSRRTGTAREIRRLTEGKVDDYIVVPTQKISSLKASAARAKIKIKIEDVDAHSQRITKIADVDLREFAASGEGLRRLIQLTRRALGHGSLFVDAIHAPDSPVEAGNRVRIKDLRYALGGRVSLVANDGKDYPYEPNTPIFTPAGDSLLAKL